MSAPTQKHIDAAIAIVDSDQFKALMAVDRIGKCAEMVAVALAEAEERETANLISIIADIRMKSGLGAKPMLGELSDAIAQAISAAEERGMKRGLERAAEIAREEANGRRKQSDDKSRFNSFERRDFDSMAIACHQVAAAITNEITPSPAAPSQRATAGSGDHPPLDPAPIHDETSRL